jgi:predicted dehydrogenase
MISPSNGDMDRLGLEQRNASVRVAVVGLGYWGPNLVRNLHEIPEFDVAYLCDLSGPKLEAVGRRYPAVRLTTDVSEVLADETVDGVLIATPVASHHSLVRAALIAGKHVFVEKPLATSSAEAEALIRLASQKERVLMPGHTFLYSPPVNMIRDLIVSGELGDIYFVSTSRVNLGLHQQDVSVIWDLGPHDFSILRYWLGEAPTHVSAMTRSCIFDDSPDIAFISLRFPSGTLAHAELSWLAPSKLRRTAIVGSRKMVVYDDTTTEPVRVFDAGVELPDPTTFGEYRLTYRTGSIVSPHVDAVEPLLLELRDFYSAIREGLTPRSSAELGYEVVRVCEAVDMSLDADGEQIELGEMVDGLLRPLGRRGGRHSSLTLDELAGADGGGVTSAE